MNLTIAIATTIGAAALDFAAIHFIKDKFEKEKLNGTAAVMPEGYGFFEFIKWILFGLIAGLFIFDNGDELLFGGVLVVLLAVHCFGFKQELEEKNKPSL